MCYTEILNIIFLCIDILVIITYNFLISGLQQQQPNERQIVPDGRSLVQREVENDGQNIEAKVFPVGQHVQSEASQEGRWGWRKTAIGSRPGTVKGQKKI